MFTPHTEAETHAMLEAIGFHSLDDLFQEVPVAYRFPHLNIPSALSEMEIMADLQDLAKTNKSTRDLVCFLGAGAYNHYIPAAVDAIIRRSEFYTAYTPYQPEISQGTLQTIFEYQTLIAVLTGMEASNASHYDGATATAEAVTLAFHHFRGMRKKVILSPFLNPQYRAVVHTYLQGYGDEISIIDKFNDDPKLGIGSLIDFIDDKTAIVIVQYPDYFGRINDYAQLINIAHSAGALVAFAVNPISLGILKPPGDFGVDIVVGEGQPLGIPLSFGGPYLGFFATKKELIRKMGGRLVGETLDSNGQRAYVLTLTAREQHIRREKATSNICTNQALMALASTVYLSLLGKQGLRQVSELCYHKAHYTAQKLSSITGFTLFSDVPFFNEFALSCPASIDEINLHLLDHGFLGGYDLSRDYPALVNTMLIAVTEMNTREEIDALCAVLSEFSHD